MFAFREDWQQDDRAKPLVRQYHLTLDALLQDRPDLRACAVRCCHCGIRFLTHPRNAGRQNLRCPFGCRQHHRRHRANERSRKHYRTAAGRRNKKHLNGKRSKSGNDAENTSPGDVDAPPSPVGPPTPERPSDARSVDSSGVESLSDPAAPDAISESPPEKAGRSENAALPLEGLLLDEPTLVNSRILAYARMVASLIEGRAISRNELIAALRKRMRQHSIGRRPHREYILRYLNQHPP